MLLLLGVLALPAPTPSDNGSTAQATVRIELPVIIRAEDWENRPKAGKRERLIRDEQGRLLLLRLVEMQ